MADVRRETCERAARAKTPLVGIPVIGEGYRTTVVLWRHYLQAACDCPGIRHIRFNPETNVLTFNGGKNRYALKNIRAIETVRTSSGWFFVWDQLRRWAESARKRGVKAKAAGGTRTPGAKRRRFEETIERQIAKLAKERDKIWDRRPSNPCVEMGRNDDGYAREREAAWAAEKPKRQALGRLAARKRLHGEPTWRKFYEAAETIVGLISDYRRHDRVCGLKDGPSRDEYLREMPKFIHMASKPDWARRLRQTEADIAGYREARGEWLAWMRERASLDSQIAGLRDELADFRAGEREVEHGN